MHMSKLMLYKAQILLAVYIVGLSSDRTHALIYQSNQIFYFWKTIVQPVVTIASNS